MIQPFEEVYEDIWRSLKESVKKKSHPFRYPTVATRHKEVVLQRMVVLRNLFISSRTLLFHTDKRSRKVLDIKEYPWISMLFYDPNRRIQLQLEGEATLHEVGSELHNDEWMDTTMPERLRYSRINSPGTPLDSTEEAQEGNTLDEARAKKNLVVVSLETELMDWLNLHPEGERRILFQWRENEWQKKPVSP
ncbi:pyridoxamine 5'-phosphate oxidase family protein [Balneolaceae bacterium ANBcel3]|nr:pyridoxamine 5'-phosphate oxidase family protein [Balneolaceae bacterium ANBcel3]